MYDLPDDPAFVFPFGVDEDRHNDAVNRKGQQDKNQQGQKVKRNIRHGPSVF